MPLEGSNFQCINKDFPNIYYHTKTFIIFLLETFIIFLLLLETFIIVLLCVWKMVLQTLAIN